jgi:hypothetical protein
MNVKVNEIWGVTSNIWKTRVLQSGVHVSFLLSFGLNVALYILSILRIYGQFILADRLTCTSSCNSRRDSTFPVDCLTYKVKWDSSTAACGGNRTWGHIMVPFSIPTHYWA